MEHQKYNGWNNYETWVTALWIDNDYGTYQHRCELVEQVKNEQEAENPTFRHQSGASRSLVI